MCMINHLDDLASCLDSTAPLWILGSLRFVLRPIVEQQSSERMRKSFDSFLAGSEELEPSDEEIGLATQLAEAAMRAGHAVDGGESLLFSVALTRSARIATGDKRAVKGLSAIVGDVPRCNGLKGAIVTLEWIISALVVRHGHEVVRISICSTPRSDKTLSICFRCHGEVCTQSDVTDALASYQRSLSQETGGFVKSTLAC